MVTLPSPANEAPGTREGDAGSPVAHEAVIQGRVNGNVRALGTIDLRAGARVVGDVSGMTVSMEPGVHFTGRCTMLESGSEAVAFEVP